MKVCSKCKIEKPWSEYHKDNRSATGHVSSCNQCQKAVRKREGAPKPKYHPEKDRWRKLLKQYGVTQAEYDQMIKEQDGVCAICNKAETEKYSNGNTRDLCVDHCHTTGQVRGLLCNKCNFALGAVKDNIETLKKAIKYLQKSSINVATL